MKYMCGLHWIRYIRFTHCWGSCLVYTPYNILSDPVMCVHNTHTHTCKAWKVSLKNRLRDLPERSSVESGGVELGPVIWYVHHIQAHTAHQCMYMLVQCVHYVVHRVAIMCVALCAALCATCLHNVYVVHTSHYPITEDTWHCVLQFNVHLQTTHSSTNSCGVGETYCPWRYVQGVKKLMPVPCTHIKYL